jgi:hypothetical protein
MEVDERLMKADKSGTFCFECTVEKWTSCIIVPIWILKLTEKNGGGLR